MKTASDLPSALAFVQPSSSPSAPGLFSSVYDVDDLISAFCAPLEPEATGRVLDTRNGHISAFFQGDTPVPPLFFFSVVPDDFLPCLLQSEAFARLYSSEQTAVAALLAQLRHPSEAPARFTEGFAGGWLRSQLKEHVLVWLEGNNLLPPSMIPVRRIATTGVACASSATPSVRQSHNRFSINIECTD